MSSERPLLDPSRVRSLFQQNRGGADFIAREVSTRMAERLQYIKLDPGVVLDAGSGAGHDLAQLKTRFARANLIALDTSDVALGACQVSQNMRSGPFFRLFEKQARTWRVCADIADLPLRSAVLDVIWSNLVLHWHGLPQSVFAEWRRCLKAGGLLMFSAFGPDTLREVRTAFAEIDGRPHTHAFTDMHDYGDMLVDAGFATPVMDMEMLTLTYAAPADLFGDVRRLGGNALLERRKGLLSREQGKRVARALDTTRGPDGRYRLSLEVLYGHAWAGVPRTTKDGRAIIRFDRDPDFAPEDRRLPR